MTHSDSNHVNVASLDALAEHGFVDVAVAIGVFDGVHVGHQALLKALNDLCRVADAAPVAVTFYPHPRAVLRPRSSPRRIASPEKKLELLRARGADAVVTIPFTRAFAALTPERFVRECLLASRVRLKGICVGEDWRFGKDGMGSEKDLRAFASQGHFRFVALEEVSVDGEPVSSTAIRRAISSGRLEEARRMLGRRFSVRGMVRRGRNVAGPRLTHPTANLDAGEEIIPPNGVYAGVVHHRNRRHAAVVAVGVSPTFNRLNGKKPRRVEAHLLDFSCDLYGETIEVEFVEHIREERCFSSEDDLHSRIRRDVERAREILNGKETS